MSGRGQPVIKKRKSGTDSSPRSFLDHWTEDYFVYPTPANDGNCFCLICSAQISGYRKQNLQRHYDTTHKSYYDEKYPHGSKVRFVKVNSLLTAVLNNESVPFQMFYT